MNVGDEYVVDESKLTGVTLALFKNTTLQLGVRYTLSRWRHEGYETGVALYLVFDGCDDSWPASIFKLHSLARHPASSRCKKGDRVAPNGLVEPRLSALDAILLLVDYIGYTMPDMPLEIAEVVTVQEEMRHRPYLRLNKAPEILIDAAYFDVVSKE